MAVECLNSGWERKEGKWSVKGEGLRVQKWNPIELSVCIQTERLSFSWTLKKKCQHYIKMTAVCSPREKHTELGPVKKFRTAALYLY